MKLNFLIAVLLFFILTNCSAQRKAHKTNTVKSTAMAVAVEKTGSKVSVKEAQEALDFHNKARQELGIEPLQWSHELSKYAQEWADHLANSNCDFDHRPDSGKWAQLYGENIYWGKGGIYTALDASKSWFKEKKSFKNVPLSSSNWSKAGHYSQMIWRKTKHVGMGVAKCKDGSYIIVANYDPAGNMMGEKAY
ncbi:MAG: CAP family protein [Bacteroidota bacterium]|nr:CAP family protein [Bacteroidota bacterium]